MTEDGSISQLVKIVTEIQQGQIQIHIGQNDILKRLDDIEAEQAIFRSAFPADDVEGHRRYHQDVIDAKVDNRKFKRTIIERTVSALIWCLIIWIGTMVWHEFARVVNFTVENIQ